jgi:hypothetical protein
MVQYFWQNTVIWSHADNNKQYIHTNLLLYCSKKIYVSNNAIHNIKQVKKEVNGGRQK